MLPKALQEFVFLAARSVLFLRQIYDLKQGSLPACLLPERYYVVFISCLHALYPKIKQSCRLERDVLDDKEFSYVYG